MIPYLGEGDSTGVVICDKCYVMTGIATSGPLLLTIEDPAWEGLNPRDY